MNRIPNALLLAALMGALVAAAPVIAADSVAPPPATPAASSDSKQWDEMKIESKRQKIDAVSGETLEKLLKENPKAKELYSKAYGYAVFDNLKMGFIFSGGGGKGEAVEMKSKKKTYMSMGSAGVGLTIGGQKYQVVFLFADSKTFNDFVNNGWAATGSASATAGVVGAGAGTQFVNGLAIYQVGEKGMMATADIAGTKYSKDKDLN